MFTVNHHDPQQQKQPLDQPYFHGQLPLEGVTFKVGIFRDHMMSLNHTFSEGNSTENPHRPERKIVWLDHVGPWIFPRR